MLPLLFSGDSRQNLSLDLLVSLGNVSDDEGGRQALLELLGLVGVLENQGVEVSLAADLELDLRLVLLDPRGGGVRPAADLDELLDISDFLRHFDGCDESPVNGLRKFKVGVGGDFSKLFSLCGFLRIGSLWVGLLHTRRPSHRQGSSRRS